MTCTDECHKPRPAQAHCSVCHKTFSAVTWFDIHRLGGKCNDIPGLVEFDGLWATKERHAKNQMLVERMAGLRKQDEELL